MSICLKIWSDAQLPPAALEKLKQGVGEHQLVFSKSLGGNLSGGSSSEDLGNADVAFGQPNPDQLLNNPNLKLVQITSAGYTRYDNDDFRNGMQSRGVPFCNSSSVYANACAQHVLAFMLAAARTLPDAIRAQDEHHEWTFDRLRPLTRVLEGSKVLIVGYGAIGKRLVELLSPFSLEIVAIRRAPRGDEPVPCYSVDQLDHHLGWAEEVVNILPANDANTKLFDADRFGKIKSGARFYNIGRGTTVDQGALIQALKSGRLSAALLDVTTPEPLPTEDPLWSAPNCTITPHIAGGYIGEEAGAVDHFLENLKRLVSGEPLTDRVF